MKPFYFPLALLFVLVVLTLAKVSGSSLGFYDTYLYEKDSLSHVNSYKAIRSDEWLVNTQMTIAQSAANYPLVNENIGDGQNMSLVIDVPYRDWSIIFKPHNLAFFVMPFDYAFAFKWWFFAVIVALSIYVFSLQFLKKKYLTSSLIATLGLLSPYLFWWYQFITLAPIYYGFFILTSLILMHSLRSKVAITLNAVVLLYLLVCFILVMYPPFQIGIVIACALFYCGYLLFLYHSKINISKIWRRVAIVIICGLMSLGVVGAFLFTRADEITSIVSSQYPGERVSVAGNTQPLYVYSNNISGLMTYPGFVDDFSEFTNDKDNQSEHSNHALPLALLSIALLYVCTVFYKKRKQQPIVYIFLTLGLALFILLAKMFLVEFGYVQKFLFLDNVPSERLMLEYGFIAIIILVLLSSYPSFLQRLTTHRKIVSIAICVTIAYTLLAIYALSFTSNIERQTVGGFALVGGFAFGLFTYLFLKRERNIALLILCAYSLVSVIGIMPLYSGKTSLITNTPLAQTIQSLHAKDPDSKWIVSDARELNMYPAANGAQSLSGIYTYPQKSIWSPVLEEAGAPEQIVDRYAHVIFRIDDVDKTNMKLRANDSFQIDINSCSPALRELKIKYVITLNPSSMDPSCTKLVSENPFPSFTTYIYKL